MKNIIEVRNVTKEYKKGHHKALNNVSLSIRENELFGLLGINGAGKTTLINIIPGLIKKTSGKVFVAGLNVDKNRDMRKIRSMINISPQETSVATNLTVQENLKFFEALYGVKDNKETDEIIKRFKLRRFLKWKVRQLSGGWQRKVSIAIALMTKSKILFFDEPTLGLDVFSRKDLWEIIKELKKGRTIILTSHYLQEIETLCDRVAILSGGHLLTVTTVKELKRRFKTNNFEKAFMKTVERSNKK